MWWRFLTFCVLVTLVLFVVLSCIHGRPVIHLFFHRCCEDDIENDQVIFENFGNNFLRERLVGVDLVFDDKESFVSDKEVEEVLKSIRNKLNVHDPKSRVELDIFPENDNETSAELLLKVEELTDDLKDENEIDFTTDKQETVTNYVSSDTLDRVAQGKVTSKNEVLSELDSDENDSAEVTTQSTSSKSRILPIKLTAADNLRTSKIYRQEEKDVDDFIKSDEKLH